MNLIRIWVIAKNGFQEVIRDRILYFILFFLIILSLALVLLPEISANTYEKIFIDFGLSAIEVFGVIVAVFVGTGLINKEIEKRTVLVLIPKPISRAEFIVGKHLGLSGVIAVMVIAMGIIYFSLLTLGNYSYPLGALIVSIFYLFLELLLITAVTIVFGVFTSSVLATLFSLGIYLMGNISQDLLKFANISENPLVQKITEILYLILPDLSRLNLKNEAVYGVLPNSLELLTHGLYGILYTIVLLAIAILIFSRRQF
jgi:ABC-type transport system involved in multi-copper enzyme maturation permease subunit